MVNAESWPGVDSFVRILYIEFVSLRKRQEVVGILK
jgi:hypothetical protein